VYCDPASAQLHHRNATHKGIVASVAKTGRGFGFVATEHDHANLFQRPFGRTGQIDISAVVCRIVLYCGKQLSRVLRKVSRQPSWKIGRLTKRTKLPRAWGSAYAGVRVRDGTTAGDQVETSRPIFSRSASGASEEWIIMSERSVCVKVPSETYKRRRQRRLRPAA
jgi:hypothetical protein